jgi:hypothetical protein
MKKPCCRQINIQALKESKWKLHLPEVYALQAVVENNDWHDDDAFQQSLRLLQWVDKLPRAFTKNLSKGEWGKLWPWFLNLLSETLKQSIDPMPQHAHSVQDLLRFTALVHDIGKTETFKREHDGTTRCPGHEVVGARRALEICTRFDFTSREVEFICALVASHGEAYDTFKQTRKLPEEERIFTEIFGHPRYFRRFLSAHKGYFLPLLLLSFGDLVTSSLPRRRLPKFEAVREFYERMLTEALEKREYDALRVKWEV